MINLAGKNVLVVEDEQMNFIYIKQIFNLTGGNITRVMTGQAAIDICREKTFDLVLMDIQLPDISGIQATKAIRLFLPDIPIIAQTACRSQTELDEVLVAGCNSILLKPFKIDEFSRIVGELL
ncbi:MAG: response regulator [Bacteroidota bacterium]|nr:MAG: response regulator [Bacteroidota bacterium]